MRSAPALASLAAPRPSAISCSVFYPLYSAIPGPNSNAALWPIYPSPYAQSPCFVSVTGLAVFHDEVHATFSSSSAYSGERWTVPLGLPSNATPGLDSLAPDVYVGMVVRGDSASVDGQSYAQVVFSPYRTLNLQLDYVVAVSVWSLHVGNAACNGLNLTWNNSYACVSEMVGGGAGHLLTATLPAGQQLNVTFVGDNTTAVGIYVNDSTTPADAYSYQLTSASTGSKNFYPAYNSSCPDRCYLNWSMPFGNGFGVDLCYAATCDSFNTTAWQQTVPPVVGAPRFWNGSAYSSDFRYVSLESASGVCEGTSGVIPCSSLNVAGQYPYFTFNGTALNFGANYSWTTVDWNRTYQFSTTGTPDDQVPFFVDQLTNDSRAGFIAQGSELNVSTRVQDFGRIASVNLSYQLPDGSRATVPMSEVLGGPSDGIFNATIPATGGDGTIRFSVNATNAAGAVRTDPATVGGTRSVVRGPIPSFVVTLLTDPLSCGTIILGGVPYVAGTQLTLPANYYPVVAHPCYPYVFNGWQTTPGISLTSPARSSYLVLSTNGTLTGAWLYVRPFDEVNLSFNPSCGAIQLNGTTYSSATSVLLLDSLSYTLTYTGCAGESFAGWTVSDPNTMSILNTTFVPHGNGTITLNFLPTSSSYALIFHTVPSWCGGILFQGAGYADNETVAVLPNTAYSIAPDPCQQWALKSWATSAGVSVSGGQITVTAPGSVTEVNYLLTEITILTYPAWCGTIVLDGTSYHNGSVVVVQNNSTHTAFAFPCLGYYFTGFYSTNGVFAIGNAVTVNASGILEAVFHTGTPREFVGFITSPNGCGSIAFNGTTFASSQYQFVRPNFSSPVVGHPCTGYGFVTWQTSGGIVVVNGTAWVNGSGSITAIFRPLVTVVLNTQPAGCGSIQVAGSTYSGGTRLSLPAPNVYALQAVPCAHYELSSWENTTGSLISGGTLTLLATAEVTAVFTPVYYDVLASVAPASCGGIRIGLDEVINNTTLALPYGNYPITPLPCGGFHLVSWNVSGAIAVAGSELEVNGSGTIGAVFQPVPPSVQLGVPDSTYAGAAVPFIATVPVLVPPYSPYRFRWSFGDGSSVSTPANFTSHVYASTGTYHVSVTVTDPYNRTATSNATITVLSAPATSALGVAAVPLGIAGVAIVAVAAAALLARRRDRRGPEGSAREAPEGLSAGEAAQPAEAEPASEPNPAAPETEEQP